MKKIYVYIILFSLLLLVMVCLKLTQENKDIDLGLESIEQSEELRKFREKFDEKGYLTEDDIKEIRKIQRKQSNSLFSKDNE